MSLDTLFQRTTYNFFKWKFYVDNTGILEISQWFDYDDLLLGCV